MMSKEDFIRRMNVLKTYTEYENKLADLGINIWEQNAVSDLITEYVDMLNQAFNLPKNDIYGTDIDYYMYELNFGADVAKYYDGEDGVFSSLNNLYDYLCSCAKS